jgi:hypothetical protein
VYLCFARKCSFFIFFFEILEYSFCTILLHVKKRFEIFRKYCNLADMYVLLGLQLECFRNLTDPFLSEQDVSCLLDHNSHSHRQSQPRFFLPSHGFPCYAASDTIRSPVLGTRHMNDRFISSFRVD